MESVAGWTTASGLREGKPMKIEASPQVRAFNAAVELVDLLTQFRYQHNSSPLFLSTLIVQEGATLLQAGRALMRAQFDLTAPPTSMKEEVLSARVSMPADSSPTEPGDAVANTPSILTAQSEAEYLGDGVYVAVQGGMLKLMTGSHDNPKDVVFLEPKVYDKLYKYAARISARGE